MKKIAHKIVNARLRKLPVLLALVGALIVPAAIRAYAEESTPPETAAQEVLAETTVVETVTPEPAPTPTPVPLPPEPPAEPEETPTQETVTPQEVNLVEAIGIAQAQHPDVEVIRAQVKLKKLNEEKVYKVVFTDGWRVYVRASDGEIVLSKDNEDKEHDCSKEGWGAVASWRAHNYKKWQKTYSKKKGREGNKESKAWWYNYHKEQTSGNDSERSSSRHED